MGRGAASSGERTRGTAGPVRRLAALGVAAVLTALPAVGTAQQPTPDGREVQTLRFVGARSVPEDTLRAAIVTAATGCRLPGIFPPCWFGLMEDRHLLDGPTLDADVLRLRLFYYRRGFREARVDAATSERGDGVRVEFRIDEGRPVRVSSLERLDSANVFPPDVLLDLPLTEGRPLNMSRYEATRDTLRARLRDRGYPRAEVLASYLIPTDSPYDARVSYSLLPGPHARFGPVTVEGASKISPTVVRRMLAFGPGDVYRPSDLLRSRRNLYGLGVLRHVDMRPRFDEGPDSIVPVTVQVNEGNLYRVRIGAGFNTTEALNAEARWTSRNFLGGARRVEARGQIANVLAGYLEYLPRFGERDELYTRLDGALSVDFQQPWFFGPRNALNAGLFGERRSLPEVFVRTARGGYLSMSRSIGRSGSVTLRYQPELTALEAQGDLFFCVNYLACAQNEIAVLQEPHWLAPVSLAFTRDRSNSLFAPTRGSVLQVDIEYAAQASGSDFAYVRLLTEWKAYHELDDGWVVAGRVKPGWARVLETPATQEGLGLNPQKRFYAGGPNSVRGFAQYRLGPKVLAIDAAEYLLERSGTQDAGAGCSLEAINTGACDARDLARERPDIFDVRPVGGAVVVEGGLELRFPLWRRKLRGAAFLDVGQVWSGTDEVHLRDLVWTPGVGVRFLSPVGPIRVDVGYNPLDQERLSVITTQVAPDPRTGEPRNTSELVRLGESVLWNPRAESFFDRLQLHFSIGQAF